MEINLCVDKCIQKELSVAHKGKGGWVQLGKWLQSGCRNLPKCWAKESVHTKHTATFFRWGKNKHQLTWSLTLSCWSKKVTECKNESNDSWYTNSDPALTEDKTTNTDKHQLEKNKMMTTLNCTFRVMLKWNATPKISKFPLSWEIQSKKKSLGNT